MEPGARLYLSADGAAGVFGDGKWRLLAAVKECGSIQEAALVLGRGYRKAWGDIKRTEQGLGRRLVMKRRGGPDGGSTSLTEFGERLIAAWTRYREEVVNSMESAYSIYLEGVVEGDTDE